MTTFLLLLSLCLNILAFFAITILFLRQNRFLQIEKKQENIISEMEEVISAYLVQMKEENDDFINRVKKLEVQTNAATAKVKETIKSGSSDQAEQNNPFRNRIAKAPVNKAAHTYKRNVTASISRTRIGAIPQKNNDKVELPPLEIYGDKAESASSQMSMTTPDKSGESFENQSFLNEVLLLKKQGLSEEEIAQKLNKGKTEIALLLKFNQNHQE
ncbi:hypothetical protein BGM26_02485 [Bacillus sp. FJAT-29790]|uniref:hypothetical protein n=1 Tax=Bacillus sp. FJAT-29790 TaxID=1895002 RepID=UPI001C249DDC|nr:hypothetical protein [Bacillus sp. FJAT-29790]MBU8877859.1 hypothetical protein [Bacillus sp. FJAT-29790]